MNYWVGYELTSFYFVCVQWVHDKLATVITAINGSESTHGLNDIYFYTLSKDNPTAVTASGTDQQWVPDMAPFTEWRARYLLAGGSH